MTHTATLLSRRDAPAGRLSLRRGVSTARVLAHGKALVRIRPPAARRLVAALTGAADALLVISGPLAFPLGAG